MSLPNDFTLDLADALLSASDSARRAVLVAAAVVEQVSDSACIVHRLRGVAAYVVAGRAGAVSIAKNSIPADGRLLAPLLSGGGALVYTGAEIEREDYAHLNVSRTVVSLAYLPVLHGGELAGAIEVLTFSDALREGDLARLEPVIRLAGPAILAAEDFERQRQNLLESVHRMSQLYDLEKSLNATLELDEVIAMVPGKAAAMLACQAMHLWLFDGGTLRLMASSGADATVEMGMMVRAGEGYVADTAEEGEALLIAEDSEAPDARLLQRNAALGDAAATPPIRSVLVVPLMDHESEVGVLEAVNKPGGSFDDDDLFFLSAMAETVSNALKNSSMMHAERKLEILQALVQVSSEITSTLRLDRLLQIIVNGPQSVLPYERCAIALDNRGTLQLKAVSGMANIPLGDAYVDQLHELMRWLSQQTVVHHMRRTGDPAVDAALPEAVVRHFEATGFHALYALPLSDDQGRVGMLIYEASDPDFLELPHTEMIKILAGQATVAIRNALLYREVPLINLLEPLMQRKQALFRTTGSRRLVFAGVGGAVAVFLLVCPLPMRVAGEAVVGPQHLVTITAPVDGTVAAVFGREGQRVAAGDLLGAMNDWQWRTDVSSAEAKYRAAEMVMESSLARGSAQAGVERSQTEFLRSEAARARSRVESAQLRSPIAGIVATPALQNVAGQHLNAGDTFAQVLDLSSAVVNIAVAQRDVALVRPGQNASIKLDSYPQRSWHGAVDVVSPEAQAGDGERTFAARVPVPNGEAVLRAGMTGRAKVFIGYRPAGYVLLRRPALWVWQTLWNWIGW